MTDADAVRPDATPPGAAGQPASNVPPSPRPTPNSPSAARGAAPRSVGLNAPSPDAAGIRPELRNWAVLDVETVADRGRAGPIRIDPVRIDPGKVDPSSNVPRKNEHPTTDIDLEATPAIEGTARVLADASAEQRPPPEPTADNAPPGSDQIDAILIAGLPHREVHVQPGSKATLVISLLNNGPVAATFDVHLEGWIHESWLEGEAQRRMLVQPGERAALPITIAPPRDGGVTAGSFPLIVVVRSPQHPKRRTRLAATLVVQPFTDFVLGRLEPASVALGAFRRTAHFALPVSNLGNHPLRLALQGQMLGLPGQVEFTDAL
ncbi:MAG: hypothetical protein ACRC1H_02295, partial [Caldilineaceae bacterium]